MVTSLLADPIAWAPPAPLWVDSDHAGMQRPALLRFVTDDFIEELQRLLATDPERLRGHLTVPETWRGIRRPARTANPRAGTGGMLARLGVTARRSAANRAPRPTPESDAATMDLKLYQPAHQRFYLVGASLVCQRPGLPDRRLDAGKQEKASFVLRRWFPPHGGLEDPLPAFDERTWTEHAFVAQPDGAFAWVAVASAAAPEASRAVVLAEEERLPLFPLSFAQDDARGRRLLAGLVPVGKRDAYHGAVRLQPNGSGGAGGSTPETARKVLFRRLVSEPWKAVVEQARAHRRVRAELPEEDPPDATELADALREARSTLQLGSWLVIADLASYLETYLPSVYDALKNDTSPGGASAAVLAVLNGTANGEKLTEELELEPPHVVAGSLAAALQAFIDNSGMLARLEQTTKPYPLRAPLASGEVNPYPPFLFLLADPMHMLEAGLPALANVDPLPPPDPAPPPGPAAATPAAPAAAAPSPEADFDEYKLRIDRFATLVILALETVPNQPEPALPIAAERPADLRDGWFQLRCVYERPACGSLHDSVVSAPSERFKLAAFFDPDAPARPIRIGLPIDTTPAGLRKFDRNTAFMMSDVLCGQVARLKGLTFGDLVLSVLPWPFHKGLSAPDKGPCATGMVCSLSIPIITICALILLIIIVSLLDLIFRWMPFFSICFPLPGFRAKK